MKKKFKKLFSVGMSLLMMGLSVHIHAAPNGEKGESGGKTADESYLSTVMEDSSETIIEEKSDEESDDSETISEQSTKSDIQSLSSSVWKHVPLEVVPKTCTYTFRELIAKLHSDGVEFWFDDCKFITSVNGCFRSWDEFFKNLEMICIIYDNEYFPVTVEGVDRLFKVLNISFEYGKGKGVLVSCKGNKLFHICGYGDSFEELRKFRQLFQRLDVKAIGICNWHASPEYPGYLCYNWLECDLGDLFYGFHFSSSNYQILKML